VESRTVAQLAATAGRRIVACIECPIRPDDPVSIPAGNCSDVAAMENILENWGALFRQGYACNAVPSAVIHLNPEPAVWSGGDAGQLLLIVPNGQRGVSAARRQAENGQHEQAQRSRTPAECGPPIRTGDGFRETS